MTRISRVELPQLSPTLLQSEYIPINLLLEFWLPKRSVQETLSPESEPLSSTISVRALSDAVC